MALETVAPLTGNAEGFDIVCSAWKHAAVTEWLSLVTGEVLRTSLNIRYKLVLDHKVGMHDLHERCAIVCAGNLDSDGAITNPMSSAMVSRMVHMVVKPSLPEWLEWALQQDNISKKLCSFLEFKPALFYTFDAANPADIYCGPRPLEFASRLMLKRWNDEVPKDKAALMAGTISEGVTTELRQYLAFFQDLPTVAEVIADPLGTPVPYNPGTLYALDGCLAEWINPDNIKTILKYVDRMPPEHIIVLMRILVRSQPTIRSNPNFLDWADANADYMIH